MKTSWIEGKIEGKLEGKIEVARRLIAKGMTVEEAAELAEVRVEQLRDACL